MQNTKQARYTPESGVIKPLSLGHMTLLKNSQAKPLIQTPNLTMIPCAFGNDGMALKPAIEFDSRLKENIGLTTPVDLRYMQKKPSRDFLKENIVTEALVSSLTSLDNFCSLPVAVRMSTGFTHTLNGPERHVSEKTVASVGMIEWGLKRLYNNLKPFDYSATNH